MNDRGRKIIRATMVAAWLLVLCFMPLLATLLCLGIWAFFSVGHRLIDGYIRLIAGLVAAGFAIRGLIFAHMILAESNLVAYAKYMYEAQYVWSGVFLCVALLLAASGGWQLWKSRASSKETANA